MIRFERFLLIFKPLFLLFDVVFMVLVGELLVRCDAEEVSLFQQALGAKTGLMNEALAKALALDLDLDLAVPVSQPTQLQVFIVLTLAVLAVGFNFQQVMDC